MPLIEVFAVIRGDCFRDDEKSFEISLYRSALDRCFGPFIPMQKTKKSVAKRFKVTATGKLLHRSPGTRHLAASKSPKQKRRLGKAKVLSNTHAVALKRCLPFG